MLDKKSRHRQADYASRSTHLPDHVAYPFRAEIE